MNNVVVVSGAQWSNSVIHIHVSTFPKTPLLSRLPNTIEERSMCCIVGP